MPPPSRVDPVPRNARCPGVSSDEASSILGTIPIGLNLHRELIIILWTRPAWAVTMGTNYGRTRPFRESAFNPAGVETDASTRPGDGRRPDDDPGGALAALGPGQ